MERTNGEDPRFAAGAWYLAQKFLAFTLWSTDENGVCRCPKGARCDQKPGKHPVFDLGLDLEHGFKDATDDPARLHTLLAARSHPNLGVLVPEGCFGWDLDGEDAQRIAEFEATLGALPTTMGHETPHGRHAVYRWPADVWRPSGHLLGVVTRWRHNGYLVAASSRIGSAVYRLRRDENGEPVPIVEFPPAWVEAALAYRSPQGKGPADEVPTGKRHPDLVSAARYLAGRDIRGDALFAALSAINAKFPGGPKPASEVRDIVAWADANIIALIAAPVETLPAESIGIDAVDLLALKLPPLRMIVPDLLPEGTTILAAPPKVGKSCLVYQIVTEVAVGGALLGRRVSPGSCLYLALEDGRRRGQDRLAAALGGRTLPRGRLEIRWGARRIGEGLEEEVLAWLDEHRDAAVVAIDTLQRVRPRTNGRRNAYEVDVDDLGRVQTLFRDRQVALLIVHHARKATGDDFLASVSGTYGITGSADTTIVIRRARLEAFGTIVVTGRDIAEAEVSARFDGMLWHEAPGVLAAASFERAELYDAIKHHGPIFPAGLAKLLHKERTNVQHMVDGLVNGGAVARTRNGYEVVPQRQTLYISPLTPITLESEQSEWGYEGVETGEEEYPPSATDPDGDVA